MIKRFPREHYKQKLVFVQDIRVGPVRIKSNRIAHGLRVYALTPFVSCQRGFCFSRLFCFRSVVVIDVFSGIACLFNNECALKHWIFERIVVGFCVISPGFVLTLSV